MVKNVLIVDSDPGFSTMLSNALNGHPAFNAIAVTSSTKALKYLESNPADLVVVDMGLDDMPALKLVRVIKKAKPDLAVMIIPLIGQDAPKEVETMDVQGILPKPFFVGDLPKLVGAAVGLDLEKEVPDLPPPQPTKSKQPPAPRPEPKPVSRPEPRPVSRPEPRQETRPRLAPRQASSRRRDAAPPSRQATRSTSAALPSLDSWKLENLRKNTEAIAEQLKQLNIEVGAEVILLTAGTELVAKAGNMADDRAQELALLVAEGAEAAAQAATFLGERDGQFEQSLHEGNDFRLYSYSLGQGVVLSLALGTRLPLGILRHNTKRTSQNLMKYLR